ncbi:FeoA family protein [Methanimicrococcus hacksteinii]|uniref:FeoA family protein n=1 Tax=Methanimicrococcus hacksteinii TaxID=3028293 RepID=UPI00298EE0EA|nr:FeoA family protein [Methanimicrococcus sp. At1]
MFKITQHGENQLNIYTAQNNTEFVVESVPDAALLSCLGIYPKSVIRKSHCYKLGGPVILHLSSRKVAVGKDLASQIIVREAE